MGEKKQEFDLFYKERGSRTEREVVWAGDGMQIWLQLLLHIFRSRDCRTIVLDEPDVYLHADLQRRLVRLLASLSSQVITATHSSEILSEADPESIMWVDRSRTKALSGARGSLLGTLAQTLGSSFNIRLARALRSRHALFVEGQDMVVLSNWASTLNAGRLAASSWLPGAPGAPTTACSKMACTRIRKAVSMSSPRSPRSVRRGSERADEPARGGGEELRREVEAVAEREASQWVFPSIPGDQHQNGRRKR
jgi:ATPase subunit of ABC transporter with duplicated ATPase domains